jgi:SAM-dependent methyltransferase
MMQPDGLSHTALYEAVGRRSWLMPSLLWSCAVPATLGRHSARQAQSASGAASAHAKDVLDWSLRGSERRLEKARRSLPAPQSSWSGYWAARDHYSAADQQTKAQIVADFLALARPMSVLDIGANTGEYSRLAGRLGARVVAIECDLAAQRLSYAAAREEKVDVLPLLVDFANPTPALGWNGRECLSFDQRAAGRFDCVLALAVVHHLLVSRGIPLDEIVKKLAAYSRKQLIIEYVSPSDPMFRKLSGRRGLDFSWLTPEAFMSLLGRHFRVVRRECVVSGVRELLLCEKH